MRRRQAAVRDLASRPLFREELYTLGADVRAAVDSARLADWAGAPAHLDTGWLRMAATALSATAVAALAAWLAGLAPGALPAVLVLANVVAGGFFRGAVSRVLHGSAEPARELAVLGAIVGRVRGESFAADRLRQLAGDLGETGDPVRTVRQIGRLIEMPRLAAQHPLRADRRLRPVGPALRHGRRGVARASRAGGDGVAADCRRDGGARVARHLPLRAGRTSRFRS